MQAYRRKVQDALTQLEAVVRGMEQFGSKPGSPIEECLNVVRSCRLYIGVFGMRYGSVPDGYDRSMTHLEYDEAQRLELPSLIYLLDENHPIPAKDVETGPGAEKLQALKEHIKKRHVISPFTTPEDLQARVMHDVPVQLDHMGVEIASGLAAAEEISDQEILKQLQLLPKLFSGRQITIEFSMGDATSASTEDCLALKLELGASVGCYVTIAGAKQACHIYGEKDMALALLAAPQKSIVRARASTAFGTYKDVDWTEDGPLTVTRVEKGLVINEILSTEPSGLE
jgi:hypothetical protein